MATLKRAAALAFWCCAAGVLVLALLPFEEKPLGLAWDKANHVLAFTVLCLLALVASARKRWITSGLLAYGMAIEALQALTPTRHAAWEDVAADAVGVGAGLVLGLFGKRLMQRGDRQPR